MSITQENPRKIHKDYLLRIEVLRSDAEDYGFVLNEASEKDFWQYIRSVPFAQKAGLVLVDNGNLRAVWKGDDESHLWDSVPRQPVGGVCHFQTPSKH